MLKFTGNYSHTEHNFVIQNLPPAKPVAELDLQIIAVLQNIFLRGAPTLMSNTLQDSLELDEYFKADDFNSQIPLITNIKQDWFSTIKGDNEYQFFPARGFYELIPQLFPDYAFIQNLILPEALISDIVEDEEKNFSGQAVDFYLEVAKLVIEIDGSQHSKEAAADRKRDELLKANDILTVRIKVQDYKNKTSAFKASVASIKNRLNEFSDELGFYSKKTYSKKENDSKLLPTACLRWQILILSLLKNGTLSFKDKNWNINILTDRIDKLTTSFATIDLLKWYLHIASLTEQKVASLPEINITENNEYQKNSINVDFSMLLRWTDENKLFPNTIFVRTDYYQSKNYFEVSSGNPIKYVIKEDGEHKEALTFLLQNIFNKEAFREGQLSIISNALNRNDTIGLLPTGSGKSICYQLAGLLQPGVSFIITPLKSLMVDQKENLDAAFITNTNFILSGNQNAAEKEMVGHNFERGKYLFMWLSPERLQIKTFREYLSSVNNKYKIQYAVIDEVHCLSEWGHDFRTSYLNLARIVRQYCPNAKFLGLTATASSRVHKDIKAEFDISDDNVKSLISFDRKELTFIVKQCSSNEKLLYTKKIVDDFDKETNFITTTGEEGKAGIIFTPHVGWNFGCYTLFTEFDKLYPGKANYFAGSVPKIKKKEIMSDSEFEEYKINVQKQFRVNKFPLLSATKSFGMGIDKPNINLTIHYGISPSIESIYQEAGRAGRHPDKENKAKSKCYILFSDEENQEIKDAIESPDTTFNELFSIQKKFEYQGDDLFRQLFFYTESFKGQNAELGDIIDLFKNYFKEKTKVRIPYYGKTDKSAKEKSIYRLHLLNAVTDYTIDFSKKQFEVSFYVKTDDSVFSGLHTYISKYESLSKNDLREKVNSLPDTSFTARSLRYLINWIYDNIAYERRQALKGIADLCRGYKNSADFKRQIVAYFEINEVTFLLQHIAENPNEYFKWFEVFLKRNKNSEIIGNTLKDRKETENLKLKLQRFLESNRNNTGLNFISGIIRLFLNEYSDEDGITRFEQSLKTIKESFDEQAQAHIFERTLEFGTSLNIIGKNNLSASLLKYFPHLFQQIYDALGDTRSLDFIIKYQTERLKTINTQLYGELTGTE